MQDAGHQAEGEDSVEDVVLCMDLGSVLFFTSDGVIRSVKARQIPQARRTAIGTTMGPPLTTPPLQPSASSPPLPLPKLLPHQQTCADRMKSHFRQNWLATAVPCCAAQQCGMQCAVRFEQGCDLAVLVCCDRLGMVRGPTQMFCWAVSRAS